MAPASKDFLLCLFVKNPLTSLEIRGLDIQASNPLIVRLTVIDGLAQVGTFLVRGCRGFIDPMYLHHSE